MSSSPASSFPYSISVFRSLVLLSVYASLPARCLLVAAARMDWWKGPLDHHYWLGDAAEVAWLAVALAQLLATVPMLIGVHLNRVRLIAPWLWIQLALLLALSALVAAHLTWTVGIAIQQQQQQQQEQQQRQQQDGVLSFSSGPFRHLVLYSALFVLDAAFLGLLRRYSRRLRKAKNLDDIHIESVASSPASSSAAAVLGRIRTRLTPEKASSRRRARTRRGRSLLATVRRRPSLRTRRQLAERLDREAGKAKDTPQLGQQPFPTPPDTGSLRRRGTGMETRRRSLSRSPGGGGGGATGGRRKMKRGAGDNYLSMMPLSLPSSLHLAPEAARAGTGTPPPLLPDFTSPAAATRPPLPPPPSPPLPPPPPPSDPNVALSTFRAQANEETANNVDKVTTDEPFSGTTATVWV